MAKQRSSDQIRSNTIRFPKQLYWKLQDLAHANNKSLNETILTALSTYIRNIEVEWGFLEPSPETLIEMVREACITDPSLVAQVVAEFTPDELTGEDTLPVK